METLQDLLENPVGWRPIRAFFGPEDEDAIKAAKRKIKRKAAKVKRKARIRAKAEALREEASCSSSAVGEEVPSTSTGIEGAAGGDVQGGSSNGSTGSVLLGTAVAHKPPKKTPSEILKIHPVMKNLKHWILEWIPDTINVRETLLIVSSVFKEKFIKIDEEMLFKELECMPHETISYFVIRTFCQLCNREDDEELKLGMKMIKTLLTRAHEENLVCLDILEGLLFLYTGLGALKLAQVMEAEPKSVQEEDVLAFIQGCPSYEDLSDKAKVSVKATEAMFVGSCRQYSEHLSELSLLEEIVKEDPESLEWKISYYFSLRTTRKRLTERRGGPSEREAKLISQLLEQDPDHVMVQLANCLYMADYAKNSWTNPEDTVVIHDVEFAKREDIFDFIRRELKRFVPRMQHSARIHLFIMEIFTSSLPFYLRDYEMAKRCLDSALEINPKSSKANHRMAVLLIFNKDYTQAVTYLKVALEADYRNYPALLDYTSILLRAPARNRPDLERIFDKVGMSSSLSNDTIGAMMTYSAIFEFMTGNDDRALAALIFAHSFVVVEPTNTLKNLDKISQRFQWEPTLISLQKMHDFLKKCLIEEILIPCDRVAITAWVAELLLVLEDQERRYLATKAYRDYTRTYKGGITAANEAIEQQTRMIQVQLDILHNFQVDQHIPPLMPLNFRGAPRGYYGGGQGQARAYVPIQPQPTQGNGRRSRRRGRRCSRGGCANCR